MEAQYPRYTNEWIMIFRITGNKSTCWERNRALNWNWSSSWPLSRKYEIFDSEAVFSYSWARNILCCLGVGGTSSHDWSVRHFPWSHAIAFTNSHAIAFTRDATGSGTTQE